MEVPLLCLSKQSHSLLNVNQVSRFFNTVAGQVIGLDDVSFSIVRGEFVALMGPSGGGKSTLLAIIGGADQPSCGSVTIDGERVPYENERALEEYRRTKVSFVFQAFHLLPTLTVEENIMFGALLGGDSHRDSLFRTKELLLRVGLTDRARVFPATLSGGEMQRVAVCRALASQAPLILADEPTGNLDSLAGEAVLNLLSEAVDSGSSILMATHSEEAQAWASRTIILRDGRIESIRLKDKY